MAASKKNQSASAKYKAFKKKLGFESGVIVGILVVFGGLVFLLSSFSDDYHNENTRLEGEVNNINNQTKTLQDKFLHLQKDSTLYQEVMDKNAKNELSIARQTLYEEYNQFKNQYYLNSLRLTMGAIEQMPGPNYKRSTSLTVSSDIVVDFNTISDEYIYGLLDGMEQGLPGGVRVTSLNLTRLRPLAPEVLREISDKGTFDLVKGTLKFTWIGIKPVDTSDITLNVPKH